MTTPVLAWWFGAESFLATTSREPADILILEAWTQEGGAQAAAAEFKRAGTTYAYIVLTGGLTGERWSRERWSHVEVAAQGLRRAGIPSGAIILAETVDAESHRTYACALAARTAMESRHLHPKAVNVLTRGAHARRSRLTFARVFGPGTRVGVIAWQPDEIPSPWWHSTYRAEEILKESVAYLHERLLHSGRWWNRSAATGRAARSTVDRRPTEIRGHARPPAPDEQFVTSHHRR